MKYGGADGIMTLPKIILYESGHTRSARCRWLLQELNLPFYSKTRGDLAQDSIRIGDLPLSKLPVAVIDGMVIFESSAICTYLADRTEGHSLGHAPGSWARGQHEQWVSFTLTQMEAFLWNNALNTFVLPKQDRLPQGFAQNQALFKQSAQVLEAALGSRKFLVEDRFSVTDIIVGWTVNWGARQGLLDQAPRLLAYLERLRARPACVLAPFKQG